MFNTILCLLLIITLRFTSTRSYGYIDTAFSLDLCAGYLIILVTNVHERTLRVMYNINIPVTQLFKSNKKPALHKPITQTLM